MIIYVYYDHRESIENCRRVVLKYGDGGYLIKKKG